MMPWIQNVYYIYVLCLIAYYIVYRWKIRKYRKKNESASFYKAHVDFYRNKQIRDLILYCYPFLWMGSIIFEGITAFSFESILSLEFGIYLLLGVWLLFLTILSFNDFYSFREKILVFLACNKYWSLEHLDEKLVEEDILLEFLRKVNKNRNKNVGLFINFNIFSFEEQNFILKKMYQDIEKIELEEQDRLIGGMFRYYKSLEIVKTIISFKSNTLLTTLISYILSNIIISNLGISGDWTKIVPLYLISYISTYVVFFFLTRIFLGYSNISSSSHVIDKELSYLEKTMDNFYLNLSREIVGEGESYAETILNAYYRENIQSENKDSPNIKKPERNQKPCK